MLYVSSQDGDLSSSGTHTTSTPPLYSFSLNPSLDASTLSLPLKLDLGVGDRGVIGRRVSVMTGSIRGPLTVAEGIMGWN
jgi:hypothetical protein